MVTPYIRTDSENINRYTCRATTAMGVLCKQLASTVNVKKDGGRWDVKDKKTD